MQSLSIQSCRQSITQALKETRTGTLDLLSQIDRSLFCYQAHAEFSPIGWHFGHIAFTEDYWILGRLSNNKPIYPEYQRLFAADGLPKHERQNLPTVETIKRYLSEVRESVLNYLTTAPIEEQERLWRWLIQHESQHVETITFIWQLHRHQLKDSDRQIEFTVPNVNRAIAQESEMVKVEAGEFILGNDEIAAMDNESPSHRVYLDTYYIDRYPVTCKQYDLFINYGGYQQSQYWSEAGWQWLQNNSVSQPLYWSDNLEYWADRPVVGVSYYEAEAYAKYVNKRLPTEAEWEKAATGTSLNCNHNRNIGLTSVVGAYPSSKYGCQDMLGNVWEWTASWFAGYPGFNSYPYSGYSEVYFDEKHRVLRGGSWATNSYALRTSFRNWYHPQVRQIFAGFRCAV